MTEHREDGWEELREAIENEIEMLPPDKAMRQFDLGAVAAYSYVLSHWPAAAPPPEPAIDVERLARVLRGAYVKGPGYTLGLSKDADEWAAILAAEYDRLGSE